MCLCKTSRNPTSAALSDLPVELFSCIPVHRVRALLVNSSQGGYVYTIVLTQKLFTEFYEAFLLALAFAVGTSDLSL